ncbi:hypothetical protein M9458_017865, partial [Cirrhinus mrigala]
ACAPVLPEPTAASHCYALRPVLSAYPEEGLPVPVGMPVRAWHLPLPAAAPTPFAIPPPTSYRRL